MADQRAAHSQTLRESVGTVLDALLRNEQRNASALFYRETLLADIERLELEVLEAQPKPQA